MPSSAFPASLDPIDRRSTPRTACNSEAGSKPALRPLRRAIEEASCAASTGDRSMDERLNSNRERISSCGRSGVVERAVKGDISGIEDEGAPGEVEVATHHGCLSREADVRYGPCRCEVERPFAVEAPTGNEDAPCGIDIDVEVQGLAQLAGRVGRFVAVAPANINGFRARRREIVERGARFVDCQFTRHEAPALVFGESHVAAEARHIPVAFVDKQPGQFCL